MKIAVCDDCMRDALSVKRFLGGHEARVYSDVDSLLADVKNKKMQYDLYFYPIIYPDYDVLSRYSSKFLPSSSSI